MNLIDVLEQRRLEAGKNGRPLSYKRFAEVMGSYIDQSTLYRLMNGKLQPRLENLQKLASWAIARGDNELIDAIAYHVFRVKLSIEIERQ